MQIHQIENPNGITIRQLREWLKSVPDGHDCDGDEHTLWINTGRSTSSQVVRIVPLNWRPETDEHVESCDVIFERANWDQNPDRGGITSS